MISRFVEFGKMSQIHVFRGSAQIITLLHWGGYQNLLQYYMGGVFPIYHNITMGGGSLGTPNLYYVIYGRPLIFFHLRIEMGRVSKVRQLSSNLKI